MIFNDNLIFIHIGKTGGRSCSSYLINNLKTPLYNCHHDVSDDIKRINRDGVFHRSDISRHCTLAEALPYISKIKGKNIKDFSSIIAVVRHPYTLEYSFYNHLKKPRVRKRRDDTELLELADGDFKTFLEHAPYHGGHSQDEYFRIDGNVPDNVNVVRFEQLTDTFPRTVMPFLREDFDQSFPHQNKTEYQLKLGKLLTDEVKELIYRKHQYIFDSGLYSRDYTPPDNLNLKNRVRSFFVR